VRMSAKSSENPKGEIGRENLPASFGIAGPQRKRLIEGRAPYGAGFRLDLQSNRNGHGLG
jgi:hypothetical protein